MNPDKDLIEALKQAEFNWKTQKIKDLDPKAEFNAWMKYFNLLKLVAHEYERTTK